MRTFGTEADNLIDVELAYGTNNYRLTWFQNGLQRDIEVTKATIHFVGAKLPLGNVTIDYMELDTSYLNFLEEDAIRIDITEDDTTLTVGTFYVAPGFTKTKYDASYTAYSSLIDLGLKLDAWDGAPESATIKDIVHHFADALNLVFDVEPSSTVTFNASVADFSSITLGELIGYCACIEQCNYVLQGNVLHKIVPTTAVTKEYNIDDVVYSENLSQTASDATLDYIKVNYKTVSRTTDDDGQVSYDFNDASYICKDGTDSCGFELNIGLVPTSESALQARFSTYFSDVKGMDCNGYNISFLGDARVELGDKLKFSNNDTAAVLNVSELIWEWDGGLKCTISSGAESSSSSGSGFSIQQVVSQIQAMTNAVKNVQYNAVYANELYAKTAELGFASINELTTEVTKMGFLTAGEADIAYAKIDFSNIEKTTIGQMFLDIGLVSDMTIVDGHITGTLSGVKITGDLFEANTIKADSLLLTGEDGVIYRINATASGLSKEELSDEKYQKYLSGTDIVSESITTKQLASNSVTAEKMYLKNLSSVTADLGTVTAGIIQSANYYVDDNGNTASGLQLDLNSGTWDSKYTKIDSDGSIACSDISIIGGMISVETSEALLPVIETYYGEKIRMQIMPNEIYSYSNGEYISVKSEAIESWTQMQAGGAKTFRYRLDEWDCECESNGYSFSDIYGKVNAFGTACNYNVSTNVTSGNSNLVTSGGVFARLSNIHLYAAPITNAKALNIRCSSLTYDANAYIVIITDGTIIIYAKIIFGYTSSSTLAAISSNNMLAIGVQNSNYLNKVDGELAINEGSTIRVKIAMTNASSGYRGWVIPLGAKPLTHSYAATWSTS